MLRRSAILFFALVLPTASFAQLAPSGAHYGGRPSDTGTGVSGGGHFSASVPLELPAARGDLPVPVEILHVGHGVGAAGLGWDVPISYVRRSSSFARRRPGMWPAAVAMGRDSLTVVLGGRGLEMVRRANTSEWYARRDAPDVVLTEELDGTWTLLDGSGRSYRFSQQAMTGLWLLRSITGPGSGARVDLQYDVVTPSLPGGIGTSIDLTQVTYNPHPTLGCPKHAIVLGYGALAPTPLSVSGVDSGFLVRRRTLLTVDVRAYTTCASFERIRRVELAYQADVDLGLPRLRSAQVLGRTSMVAPPIPIGLYEYGAATASDGKLRWVQQPDVAKPVGASPELASTREFAESMPDGAHAYSMWQTLTDLTGDGRPDLVFKQNGELRVSVNVPGAPGVSTFAASAPLSDAQLSARPFSTSTGTHFRFNYGLSFNRNNTWRKQVDVNGDGRIDLVDASEAPETWAVYLNTPDPGVASGVKWLRRTWNVSRLRVHLGVLGHELPGGFVPLSRRYTGRDQDIVECLKVQGGQWLPHPAGWPATECPIPSSATPTGNEQSYTEWDVLDANGDGYPDVVLNSEKVGSIATTGLGQAPEGTVFNGVRHYAVRFPFNHANLEVFWNVVGPRFDLGSDVFSAFEVLGSGGSCGLEIWSDTTANEQTLGCGLMDVNGDGVADRVVGQTVALGTGRGFSPLTISLPAAIRQYSQHDLTCAPGPGYDPAKTYDVFQLSGLRDLNGDGFPDFVDSAGIHLGTGTGFASPKATDGLFSLSTVSENCAGERSITTHGLFDLDGDGKPEVLRAMAGSYQVWQLTAGSVPRTPEAGRLVAIENGFGARTQVTYGSAKDDASTPHQVAAPEVVVTSVQTTGLAATRYAYGHAQLYLDGVADGFHFPGYGRVVELVVPIAYGNKSNGTATLRDSLPLAPFAFGAPDVRFSRYALAGRGGDETVLAGAVGDNAWALLTVDLAADPRRVSNVHTDWKARYLQEQGLPVGHSANDCFDLMIPYDYQTSAGNNGGTAYAPCSARGFAYEEVTTIWRGIEAPPSVNNVQARTRALTVDDFGRQRLLKVENDLFRGDDDLCIDTTYATPAGSAVRRLDLVWERVVDNCPAPPSLPQVVYAHEVYEYDGLTSDDEGTYQIGRRTAHIANRRATDNGAFLGFRRFDFAYDALGNVVEMTKERLADGVVQTLFFDYDPFGLVPIGTETVASGVPSSSETYDVDPVTLEVLFSTDKNGTRWGTEYDAFGRATRRTVTPPGGALGVVATVTYDGFQQSGLRRVTTKRFADPVPPAAVPSAVGVSEVTSLDALGRQTRTERALGASYGGETLVTRSVTFDLLGRVAFSADPYPVSESASTAYGTTFFFEPDGTPTCSIRGRGPQALATTTDHSVERYPTCYQRSFVNHTETSIVRGPDALEVGTPQADVATIETYTAIGRLVSRGTWKGLVPQDMMTFGYDRLGAMTAMSRFFDPLALGLAVSLGWRRDTFGAPIHETRADSPVRTHTYSEWGELTETRWTDAGVERRLETQYDALGRVTRNFERVAGVIDPATDNQYVYDTAQPVPPSGAPLPPATNLLGRLTKATSPTGAVHRSYDAFGNVASQVFTTPAGAVYVEETVLRFDGAPAALKLRLPDTAYALEQANFTYDSADALRKVTVAGKTLYDAQQIDPFGRVRVASFGTNNFEASHAETGRRLPIWDKVSSASGYRVVDHLGFDALGRETSVKLTKNGGPATGMKTNLAYDAIGRLASATTTENQVTLHGNSYTYDPLGNLKKLADSASTADATLTFKTSGDRDRICRIHYGDTPPTTTPCNVVYDGSGNVLSQATRSGAMRSLTYFGSGQVRTLDQGTAHASFRYDPFGALQELDVFGPGVTDPRQDRHYGAHIESRGGVLWRRLPGLAVRKGPAGAWLFLFGEERGLRFTTNEGGSFLQDVRYAAFGEATSSISPANPDYTSEQWNGGDTLAAFGLVQLGARLYDPVIGRFLQRDPLVIPRTAARTNPYAFAMNDPHNLSDPTGLDACAGNFGKECAYLDPEGWTAGVILAMAVYGKVGISPGSRFNYYGLAKSKTPLEAVIDLVKHEEDPKSFDRRENAGIIRMQSLYMALGDAALKWCFKCGGQDFRDAVGFTPLNIDEDVYNQVHFMGNVARMAAGIPSIDVDPLERGMPTVGTSPKQQQQQQQPQSATSAAPPPGARSGPNCFVAGTLVASEGGLRPIETLRLGERVDAGNPRCADDHLPIDAVTVGIESERGHRIALVRTAAWLAASGLGRGEAVVSLDDIGLSGRVRVVSIGAPPVEQAGEGCLVTMTATHVADEILAFTFEDGTRLELTPTHPLFVEDRGWVRAGEMQVGDAVRSDGGPLRLDAVASQPGQRVYNVEVAREHWYMVSARRIWTHNQSWDQYYDDVARFVDPILQRRVGAQYGSLDRELHVATMYQYVAGEISRPGSKLHEALTRDGTLNLVRNALLGLRRHPTSWALIERGWIH